MTKLNPIVSKELDFEQVERDMGKLLIEVVCDRANNFAQLNDKMRKEWLKHVQELVAYFDWKQNPTLIVFPVAQLAVGCLQIAKANADKPTVKSWGSVEKMVSAAKEFFNTSDTGKRTEIEAKRDSARMNNENTDRELQSLMQQLSEHLRKLDDAQRKNYDGQLGMTK